MNLLKRVALLTHWPPGTSMAIRLHPQAESVLSTGGAVRCAESAYCMIIPECCTVKASRITMQKLSGQCVTTYCNITHRVESVYVCCLVLSMWRLY